MESSFETEEELESQYRQIGAIHDYEPPPTGATRIAHAKWKLKMNRRLDTRKRQLEEDNKLKERCVETGKPDAYDPGCLGESSPDRKKRFRRINTAIASEDDNRKRKDYQSARYKDRKKKKNAEQRKERYEFMNFVNRADVQISDAERDAKKMDQRFRVDNSNRFRIDACAICDRVIKGTAKSCFISIEDLKSKADRIGCDSYEAYYGDGSLPQILKEQVGAHLAVEFCRAFANSRPVSIKTVQRSVRRPATLRSRQVQREGCLCM